MNLAFQLIIHDRTEYRVVIEADTVDAAVTHFDELVTRNPNWRTEADIVGGAVQIHHIEVDRAEAAGGHDQ